MTKDENIVKRAQIKHIFNEEAKELLAKNSHCSYIFKKYFPKEYQDVFICTSFLDVQNPTFRARIHCILNDIFQIPICKNLNCNKQLDIHDDRPVNKPREYCCNHCCMTDEVRIQRMKDTIKARTPEYQQQLSDQKRQTLQRLAKENPNYWNDISKKTKATKKAKYGNEKYVNINKIKQTKLERYGDANYSNREKAKQTVSNKTEEQKQREIQKRLDTVNKKKQEDPNYMSNIVAKSKVTRIANNGEDYTGRKKCRQTMLQRYGVENAYQLDSVKENIKKKNLEKYGVEYYSSTKECRLKVANTCIERYGNECYFGSAIGREKIKQTNLERSGCEYSWQREDTKNHIKETNLAKYGYESAMQNPEIRKKAQARYSYNGISFDSSWELAYFIWLTDNGVDFEYQPNVKIEYQHEGKSHYYCPDFIVNGKMIEFKGNQFFENKDSSNKMINPYDRLQDALYEAKHQCMIQNNVMILTDEIANEYVHYIEQKYGKDYLQSFRRQK